MDGEMKEALKGYNLSWQSREGSPYAAADLTRVSAGSAAMIVLMRPESDQVSGNDAMPLFQAFDVAFLQCHFSMVQCRQAELPVLHHIPRCA